MASSDPRAGGIEKDLADEDEIMAAAAGGGGEALAKARERFGGDALDGDESVFLEAGDLAREGMKFAVARENARHRARRQRGDEPADEVVGVGRERDGRGIGQGENGGDATLRARDELAEDRFPFVVGEPRGVGERAAMGLARRVRPKMMAVRRQMNAPRLRRAKLGEMPAQIERHHAPGLAAYRYPMASSSSRGSLGNRERGMR